MIGLVWGPIGVRVNGDITLAGRFDIATYKKNEKKYPNIDEKGIDLSLQIYFFYSNKPSQNKLKNFLPYHNAHICLSLLLLLL